MTTIYTLFAQSFSSDTSPSVTVHNSLADLGTRLLEEWSETPEREFADDEDGIDGLIQLIEGEHLGVHFTWDSHEVDIPPAPIKVPASLVPTDAIIEDALVRLAENFDLDEDFCCVKDNYAGGFDEVRSAVSRCWEAVSDVLHERKLPMLTSGWDANASGQMDGWAIMVSVFAPDESYSLGTWGDDGDVSMDDDAKGRAAARAYLANVLHHYEILLGKFVRLGKWTP